MPLQTAECDLKIILEHDPAPVQRILQIMGNGAQDLDPEPDAGPEPAFFRDLACIQLFDISEEAVIFSTTEHTAEKPDSQAERGLFV